MSETLYRVANRDALERLRAAGVRIVFRFRGGVVLREPLGRAIDGVTEIDPSALPVPARVTPDTIGEVAYALRRSPAWRARKARRPHTDVSMDQIIGGDADKTP
jgi:hypothetical protein